MKKDKNGFNKVVHVFTSLFIKIVVKITAVIEL